MCEVQQQDHSLILAVLWYMAVMDLIFFLFLYAEFTAVVSLDSGFKFLCFHGNLQLANRSSMFLNYSRTVHS